MSILKTRIRKLTPALRDNINQALRDPASYNSNEMDFIPWLILLFIGAVSGLIASLVNVSWEMVENSIKLDGDWFYTATNNPELPGMAAGGFIMLFCIWYYFSIHNRCGQVIFPGYVAKVRGGRIILLNISEVSEVETHTFEYGSTEKNTRRTGTSLEVKLKDGSKFKILSDNGYWLTKVKDHINSGIS